jgi:hypothetical protein
MSTAIITTEDDWAWAEEQVEAISPDQESIRAFDASPDGTRYQSITGMSMWVNLAAGTLPATPELEDDEWIHIVGTEAIREELVSFPISAEAICEDLIDIPGM